MRLSAYRTFHRTVQRLRVLYEATMHSYRVLYENGREELKISGASTSKIKFSFGTQEVERPLKVVTFHARDVYPELLRSTLLVRLVAAYEAFLVDAVEEISFRSDQPFKNSSRVDFSTEQLITIESNEGIYDYLVSQTLRRLTSGGLKEIRKFYEKSLACELCKDLADMPLVEEIHDRRHLYVHRAGYVDRLYEGKYPNSGAYEGELLPVSDTYLIDAFWRLDRSAKHIKATLEQKYPSPPVRRYVPGRVKLEALPENLQYLEFEPCTPQARSRFSDLSLEIRKGRSFADMVGWMSDDGRALRFMISGDKHDLKAIGLLLRDALDAGEIRDVNRFKIWRPNLDGKQAHSE